MNFFPGFFDSFIIIYYICMLSFFFSRIENKSIY